ncbi:putative DNA repair helicase [Leptomonas seymouri]|uniref:Putative DNA repair helicase n=1 Tax=Leptomonas seymouri TaxID=5684 RepID=A0A0N1I170_LEPSE|nr:putative DNA repair helicase [Leptomonas seymouri]|eukprot:KPI83915.1 putative DNA repair helicase [Leptomonas seymouri]
MQRVGPYHIPLPYAPYPLQTHAMTALRDFLEGTADSTSSEHPTPHESACIEAETKATTPTSNATKIAVLESPTGTGKSQMLLNSVLSFLFEPVFSVDSDAEARHYAAAAASAPSDHAIDGGTAPHSGGNGAEATMPSAVSSGAAPPKPKTLDDIIKQRQLEEEIDQLRRERKARVRAQRRQLRKARTLWRLQQQQSKGEADEEHLLAQDPAAWYAEQHASMDLPSSSSSASSTSPCESDNDDGDISSDAAEAEGLLETHLATMIPLRKPKVYFASRTHTQLQQLMEDLQKTAFAAYPLRVRASAALPPSTGVLSATTTRTFFVSENDREGDADASAAPSLGISATRGGDALNDTSPLHRLTAVHVAGRSHLCINARIQRAAAAAAAANSGEILNHYCREAMQYERSKQGRADRRERQRRQQQQGLTSADFISTEKGGGSEWQTPRDIEDLPSTYGSHLPKSGGIDGLTAAGAEGNVNEDKGCAFCAESRLRALMEHIAAEQREQQRADLHAAASRVHNDGGTPPPCTPSTSIYTMKRLLHLGRELQACPYLATRLLLRGADLAFIPYSYLLDEDQRAVLLGGVTTNPATAAEAEALGLPDDADDDDSLARGVTAEGPSTEMGVTTASWPTAPPAVSLGSVLYHRRQRVTATTTFRQGRKAQQQVEAKADKMHRTSSSSIHSIGGAAAEAQRAGHNEDEDKVWHAIAHSAPPSFRRDILVFDEAHNIADHCRAISTASLSPWHLQLTESLCSAYLSRYESRLLTRNKQRLRELIRFLSRLSQFCVAASAAAAPSPASETRVHPLHAFLFEAGIDSVDAYSLLMFLVDSQLLIKLQGFVGYSLERERQDVETEAVAGAARLRLPAAAAPQPTAPAGAKRKRTADKAEEAYGTRIDERQRRRLSLSALSSDVPASSGAAPCEASRPHASGPTVGQPSSSVSVPDPSGASGTLAALLRTHAGADGVGTPLEVTRQRAIAAEALQRVERLLRALYISDAVTTRVIWTSSPPTPQAGETNKAVLKLIQLEPGTHTFAPLAREAKAVVLAGGTMQPLALTCGPLLPAHQNSSSPQPQRGTGADVHRENSASSASTANDRERIAAAASATAAGGLHPAAEMPWRLISEGHTVPPTSVRVFTLGTGPSAVRLEFTQQMLRDHGRGLARSGATSGNNPSADAASPAARMLVEVGCTLLNLSRVLPPAGAICFFVSYDMMERVVAVLQSTGYYDQINEVKPIFCETRGGKGGRNRSRGDGTGGAGVAEVLQQYQSWIYDERVDASAAPSGLPSSLTPSPAKGKVARRGALLFAVMGGRLSEGINFADDLGRAVILFGMPYANPTDVELQLNLRHIASTRLPHGATGQTPRSVSANEEGHHNGVVADSGSCARQPITALTPSPAPLFASATEWGLYMDGMMQTVNQCVGRCIRHAGDYAVVILIDARYGERADVRRRLSTWLQPSLQVCRSFGECFAGVRAFFAARRAAPE